MPLAQRIVTVTFTVITVAAVVIASLELLVGVLGFGFLLPNPVQARFAPITLALAANGGAKLCEDGWNGYGPADTTEAWYYVSYVAPDTPAMRKAVFEQASQLGYPLAVDRNASRSLGESEYVSHRSKPSEIDLTIDRHRTFRANCGPFSVDRSFDIPKNDAVYDFGF